MGNAALVISKEYNGFGEEGRVERRGGEGQAEGKRRERTPGAGSLVIEACALGLNRRRRPCSQASAGFHSRRRGQT